MGTLRNEWNMEERLIVYRVYKNNIWDSELMFVKRNASLRSIYKNVKDREPDNNFWIVW